MNIKLALTSVERAFDKKVPLEQLYKNIVPITSKSGILFAEPAVGAGYLMWSLDGEGWIAFSDLDNTEKSYAAEEFVERRNRVIASFNGAKLANDLFTVPSDDYIFFRKNGETYDIAIAAWAYRFPNSLSTHELDTWMHKIEKQAVHISFVWNDVTLANYPFKILGQRRSTDNTGWFHVDKELPVGKSYEIETDLDGTDSLLVEKNKAEYIYDLTKYYNVEVCVVKDSLPLQDCTCTIRFAETEMNCITNSSGLVSMRLPLCLTEQYEILNPQPECLVTCEGSSRSLVPVGEGDTLNFSFDFETPKENISEEPEDIKLPPPPQEEVVEYVKFKFLDYEGFPVKNMPIQLTTKKSGILKLVSDENGCFCIPKNDLEHNEKLKFEFTVTPEYQENNDIHYYKS